MTLQVASIASWRPATRRRQEAAAVALAAVLSAYMLWQVVVHHDGGLAAGVAALAMTVPMAWAGVSPTSAGVSLALGAGINEAFFGHLIRCGPGLPAAFFVAFAAGSALGPTDPSRRIGRFDGAGGLGAIGLVGGLASVVLQCVFDPNLGAGVIALMAPVTIAFYAAGRYVRRRARLVSALRHTTARLAEQREATARLAVAADRERITDQLDLVLQQRLDVIDEVIHGSAGRPEAFVLVEQVGRQTLDGMRDLLGSLRDSPVEPEPGLSDLADVCARATSARVRLTVNGSVRQLPASVELSACRIVEQLVRLLADQPSARVQLRVEFALDGLDIAVSGHPTADVDVPHVRALAGARAAVHHGTVDVIDDSGRRSARVWLPLMATHA